MAIEKYQRFDTKGKLLEERDVEAPVLRKSAVDRRIDGILEAFKAVPEVSSKVNLEGLKGGGAAAASVNASSKK